MTLVKIGTQHGIDAATAAEISDGGSSHKAGYSKRGETLKTLVNNSNESIDKIASLEAAVKAIPFPLVSS